MNNYTPSVSIIVAVYNGARTIENCLKGLLSQDYPNDKFEILIVENGSTDDTTAIIERYPVKLLHSPVRGLARARNYGIERATGEIIAMTDADCIADPHWITALVETYKDPDVGGAGGPVEDFVHNNMNWAEQFATEARPLVNYISGSHEFLPHLVGANSSYRRSLLYDAGLYNPGIPTYYGEDIEFSWRFQIKTGKKLAYAPAAIINHHHRSTTSGLLKQYRNYGFGEIFLDTLFAKQPNYPRTLRYQSLRIGKQMAVLPKYLASAHIRYVRFLRGRISSYEAVRPLYSFMVESNNVIGKIDAIFQTGLMKDPSKILRDTNKYD